MIKKALVLFILFFSGGAFSQDITKTDIPEEFLENLGKLDQDLKNKDQIDFKIEPKGKETSVTHKEDLKNTSDQIFGLGFINKFPLNLDLKPNLPVPSDYVISLNDKFQLILSGARNEIIELVVGLDGAVLIPEVGKVQVSGQKYNEVFEKISNLIELSYVGVDVDLSLVGLSAKKVSIVGAVNNPGSYLVNPFTTISTVLAYSGGLKDFASLRNIVVIRGNERKIYDLYDLLIFGDRSKDISIQQGDTILINPTTKHIKIEGEVLRPMIYEYSSNDSYADLILFAMGFTSNANSKELYAEENLNGVLVSRIENPGGIIGDRKLNFLKVGNRQQSIDMGIRVEGKGVEEKFFEKGSYASLGELISNLKFSTNIYPFYAKFKQTSIDGLSREMKVFSLADKSTYENIYLKENIELRFFSRDEINSFQEYFFQSLDLKDENLVESNLEEIDPTSEASKIRVSDLVIVTFGNENYLMPIVGEISPKKVFDFYESDQNFNESLVSVSTKGKIIQGDVNINIRANQISHINFPQLDSAKFFIEISGQVNNPGVFSVSNDMTLEEAYRIAGGFKENANVNGIVLSRESIRIKEQNSIVNAKKSILDAAISSLGNPLNSGNSNYAELLPILTIAESIEYSGRLSGNLSPGSSDAKKIILEKGDKIYVPTQSTTISVFGEVLQPTSITINSKKTYWDYIELSGRFTSFADKNNIYVIRSDGSSIPIKYRDLKKLYPDPGDSIIVPRDIDKLNTIPLLSTSIKIISDVAFAAASLSTLRN